MGERDLGKEAESVSREDVRAQRISLRALLPWLRLGS